MFCSQKESFPWFRSMSSQLNQSFQDEQSLEHY